MQWVAQQFTASAPVSTPASMLPNSSPPPAFMKLAHVTGPLTGDAFVFVLSKMKQDGFTAVLVTVSLDDWRLQRLMIVSRRFAHCSTNSYCPSGRSPYLSILFNLTRISSSLSDPMPNCSAFALRHVCISLFTGTCQSPQPPWHHAYCILYSAAAINYNTCLFMRVFLEISPWLDASSSQQVRSVHLDALARTIRHLQFIFPPEFRVPITN